MDSDAGGMMTGTEIPGRVMASALDVRVYV